MLVDRGLEHLVDVRATHNRATLVEGLSRALHQGQRSRTAITSRTTVTKPLQRKGRPHMSISTAS
jgi:hypothetical protein